MAYGLPPGCTDSDVDEASPGYYDHPIRECCHCGEQVGSDKLTWVEPNNLGFSGWDEGQWLCPDCYDDWKWGAIEL